MSKIELKLDEVANLNVELQLMNKEKELSFVIKYKIAKFLEKTTGIIKNFEKTRLSVFKSYGSENKDGTWTLKGAKDEKKGLKELEALLEVKETFDETFNLKDFEEIKSENSYVQIMKFMKE